MKKLIFAIFALIILSVGFYFKKEIAGAAEKILFYSPCDTPIAFSIGTIDPRFKLTQDQILNDIQDAAEIWDGTVGKKLFTYDPASKFTVNFVFDSRQELTDKIGQMDTNLQHEENQIKPQMAEYQRRAAQFDKDLADLNQQISYWNAKGGAPEDTYKQLIARQSQLQKEADTLNSMAKSLGQATKTYNLNADKLNQTISTYQDTLQNKPEEGVYIQNGNEKTINIYLSITEKELKHTLAHELGHALGINHVPDASSIMYPKTSESLTPVQDEIDQLQKICQKKNIFQIAMERYAILINYLLQNFQQKTSVQGSL